jgi:hypothetical protein
MATGPLGIFPVSQRANPPLMKNVNIKISEVVKQ